MKKFERQVQSQRKHGPLPVSSASKAPLPPPRSRPEWAGPGYVKRATPRPRPVSTPQGPVLTIQEQCLPVELQQLVLDVFRDTFPASRDFNAMKPLLQEINYFLLNGDAGAAYAKQEFLEGYTIRWSPSRALALSNLLAWICEQRRSEEWVKRLIGHGGEKPLKTLCFGGGATEIVAFSGLLRQFRKTAAGRPNAAFPAKSDHLPENSSALSDSTSPMSPLNLHLVDRADWSLVIAKLYDGLTTAPTLSKYASATARASNAPLISPQALTSDFHRADVLDLTFDGLRSMISLEPALLSLFFVLNDLYNTSIRKTTTFLQKLSILAPRGCLLLVVDTHDATTSGILANDNQENKEYPMSWLLNKAILPTREKQGDDDEEEPEAVWEKLIDDGNRLYKLPEKGLSYPASLENMKIQVHLFKRL